MSDVKAPKDCLFVCCACGKTSKNLYGSGERASGWDASCVLNARLFKKSDLEYGNDNRVNKINGPEIKHEN